MDTYVWSLRLIIPKRPTKPVPNSPSVLGSGTTEKLPGALRNRVCDRESNPALELIVTLEINSELMVVIVKKLLPVVPGYVKFWIFPPANLTITIMSPRCLSTGSMRIDEKKKPGTVIVTLLRGALFAATMAACPLVPVSMFVMERNTTVIPVWFV